MPLVWGVVIKIKNELGVNSEAERTEPRCPKGRESEWGSCRGGGLLTHYLGAWRTAIAY